MSTVLVLLGWGLMSTPAVTLPLSRQVTAVFWQRLVSTALIGGAATVELGMVLWALPTLFSALGMSSFAQICARIAGHLFPGSRPAGWLALAVALIMPYAAVRRRVRYNRDAQTVRLRINQAGARPWEWGIATVVADDEPQAFAVAGSPSYVVMTSGLLERLSPDEVAAVLAHEEAHLALQHHQALRGAAMVEAVFGLIPPVRRSVDILRLAVERAADEEAGSTLEVRQALKSAILRMVGVRYPSEPLSLSRAETVAARLDCLSGPPTRRSPWKEMASVAPVSLLGGLGVGVLYAWLGDVHLSLTLAGICWL